MRDDILLHYGKKGMKWGVRKARETIKDYVKKYNAKTIVKLDKYHEKNKDKRLYKSLYKDGKRIYNSNHHAAVAYARNQKHAMGMMATGLGLMALGTHTGASATANAAAMGSHYARKFARYATSPENIRRSKNIIQFMKGSKLRYADVSKYKDIINPKNAKKLGGLLR